MKKRALAFLLAALLLCGCAAQTPPATVPTALETTPATVAAVSQTEAVTEPSEEPMPTAPWYYHVTSIPQCLETLGLLPEQIGAITYLDTLENTPDTVLEVSYPGHGSVKAWSEPMGDLAHLYIAAEDGVRGDSSFEDLVNLQTVDFNGAFHTDYRTHTSFMFYNCSALTAVDLSGLNLSRVTDMHYMFAGCSSLEQADLSGLSLPVLENMESMFRDCEDLVQADLSGLDIPSVTDMNGLFYNCPSLVRADLSSMSAPCAANMSNLFLNCQSLTEVDLTGIDTSGARDMSGMFCQCRSLNALDLSCLDTGNVTTMAGMFTWCESLTQLDLSCLDTGKVTDMSSMFSCCMALEYLDMSGLDLRNLESTADMFNNGSPTLQVDRTGQVTQTPEDLPAGTPRWYLNYLMTDNGSYDPQLPAFRMDVPRSQIGAIIFLDTLADMPDSAWDVSFYQNGAVMAWSEPQGSLLCLYIAAEGGVRAPESCIRLFCGMTQLTSIDFGTAFHTEFTISMDSMFQGCAALTRLDLSGLDTGKVSGMADMFSGCGSLQELNLAGFDTSGATDMGWMFAGCESLKSLDVSGFDTSNVIHMRGMFEDCTALETLDVSGFDISGIDSLFNTFAGCGSLTYLDVSSWNTAQVTDMVQTFSGCTALADLDLSGWNTAQVTDLSDMFWDCDGLTEPAGGGKYNFLPNIRSWDLSSLDLELYSGVASSSVYYDGSKLNNWFEDRAR